MIDFNGGVTTNPALIDTAGLSLDSININPATSMLDWGNEYSVPNLMTMSGSGTSSDLLNLDFGKSKQGMSNFSKGVAGLQTLGSVMGAWNGYQQNKLAKQQLAFQKDAFNKQYSAQRNLTNSQLEDRQRNRVYQNEQTGRTGTMSVAEYMNKYGIK